MRSCVTAAARRQPCRSFARTGVAPVFPEAVGIYTKETDTLRVVSFNPDERKTGKESPEFRRFLNDAFLRHRPSKHPLFAALKKAPAHVVNDQGFLNEFYVRYQSCMHATRVAVYWTPYLNVASLRQKKLAILADDDSNEKNSHHKQLENMFRSFGAEPRPDTFFGDLDELAQNVDPQTACFIRTADRLYRQSTGAWTIAEVLSDEWLSALCDSLQTHFPQTRKAEYFDEVLTGHIEVLHMCETVELTENVLHRKPAMLRPTLEHAAEMATALDGLWTQLYHLVQRPEPFLTKKLA